MMNKYRHLIVKLVLLLMAVDVSAWACGQVNLPKQNDRWGIRPDGSIQWEIDSRLPHSDHIEMGGEQAVLWMRYGVDKNGSPVLSRTLVFPTFRLLPVQTIAHMMYNVEDADLPRIIINGKLFKAGVFNAGEQKGMAEKVTRITQKGIMDVYSKIGTEGLELHRTYFPSVEKPLAFEKMVFTNHSQKQITVEMEYLRREVRPGTQRSTPDQHRFIISSINEGIKNLQPGDSATFAVSFQAVRGGKEPVVVKIEDEQQARQNRVAQILSKLVLETPNVTLNTMFAFAKIRGTESIYKTKRGYMHGPGGLRYYAAIWANDEAEYINPFFAFLGDTIGIESSMNAYRMFAKYMNPDYNPIPSSIIAQGDATWHGAGDRGDMAMIAYGAGRYALAYGNADSAKVLWPLIEWCLEYCHRKLNIEGVVWSNKDELEGRFPAGDANLNTSSLYYDALRSAVMLGKQIGKPASQIKQYGKEAKLMKVNIEKYFGGTVEGYKTYHYYKGNDTLRAWITTPLVMDIFDRKKGTIDALFSPRLWTEDGLASLAGDKTFWDRSTLYGLRGVFAAGETEKALRFLKYYSERRLLGEHVPYAVEAYPEGNQRHLSAESGLYCRIYTEGMFGMRPTGFNSFECTPHLPKEWNKMALRNVHAFQNVFDLEVARVGANRLTITLVKGNDRKVYTVKDGDGQSIKL